VPFDLEDVILTEYDKCTELHLLEYHKEVLEYLEISQSLPSCQLEGPVKLEPFSEPNDKCGYNDSPISDDMITEVFVEFSERTRREESDEYIRTRTGMIWRITLIGHHLGLIQLKAGASRETPPSKLGGNPLCRTQRASDQR